jgi:hypothetical protein
VRNLVLRILAWIVYHAAWLGFRLLPKDQRVALQAEIDQRKRETKYL